VTWRAARWTVSQNTHATQQSAKPIIFRFVKVRQHAIRGWIPNIPDRCRHLCSSCGSAKQRYMVALPCLVSQYAELHVAGWTWAVLTRVFSSDVYEWYSVSPEYFGYTVAHSQLNWAILLCDIMHSGKNWINCAIITGNSAGLRTVLSTRLAHRELRS
jgi:hypothetical protein